MPFPALHSRFLDRHSRSGHILGRNPAARRVHISCQRHGRAHAAYAAEPEPVLLGRDVQLQSVASEIGVKTRVSQLFGGMFVSEEADAPRGVRISVALASHDTARTAVPSTPIRAGPFSKSFKSGPIQLRPPVMKLFDTEAVA